MNDQQATGIGIDLGGTKIEAVVASHDKILDRVRIATPKKSYQATVDAIVGLVDGLCDQPVPVGIGTPGVYRADEQKMVNCNSTWLNGMPLLPDLQSRLGNRVTLANDANCFVLSEATGGAAKNWKSAFGVILGTGVGGGVAIDQHLLTGVNGIAGEWGHTPLPYFQQDTLLDRALAELEARLVPRTCYCGRINCIEMFLAGPALASLHTQLWGEVETPQELGKQATDKAVKTLALYFHMLSRSLAQLVNVIDPVGIVFGGGLSQLPNLVSQVAKIMPRYVFSERVLTQLAVAEHGDSSGVLGALRLAQQKG